MIVDALNSPRVLKFYSENKFRFLFTTDTQELAYEKVNANQEKPNTRLMYFDLLDLSNS